MLCMTNFARAHRPRRARRRRQARSLRGDKSHDIIRCDSFSHYACGREFTFWMQPPATSPRRCWRAGENIAWGTGSLRHRALDLPRLDALPGAPREHPRLLQADRDRPAGRRPRRHTRGAHVWTQHFGTAHADGAPR